MGNGSDDKLMQIMQISHVAKFVYDVLISDCYVREEKVDKWVKILEIQLSLEDYLKYFRNIYSMTNVSELHSFQYRLLLHALVFNRFLFLCK